MKGKKIFIAVAAVVVLVAAGMMLSSGGQEVSSVKVEKGVISRQIRETAIVQPAEDATLYATQNARVIELPVEIGQTVVAGQVLLQLGNLDLELQLTETKSSLDQAQSAITAATSGVQQLKIKLENTRTNLERTQSLYDIQAISKSEYEKAILAVESTQADLNQQQSLLDTYVSQVQGASTQVKQLEEKKAELLIISPIDGTVIDLPVKIAQPVLPGTQLAAVGSSDDLEIKADILSDDLANVKVGQDVFVTAPVLGSKELHGELAKIYPAADEKMSALGVIQRRVPVIININDKANLQPGYEVRVAIETARLEDVLIVPLESVLSLPNNKKQVMLIHNQRVKHQEVETGLTDGSNIQIALGLEEGDLIVQDANLNLKENARVK